MSVKEFPKLAVLMLGVLAWGMLFVSGLLHYAGSKTLYAAFSAVFLLLLLSAVYRPASFAYVFLAIFIWLGFWFKLTANFLLFGSFPFGEPAGGFTGLPEAWDMVLQIATVAALGVILGRVLFELLRPAPYRVTSWAYAPGWYGAVRKWMWALTIWMIVAASVFNIVFGIHQIGVAPRTVFPWPTNALVAWFLNIGAAFCVAVLICWDVSLGKRIQWPAFGILGEAFLTTVSVISRAAFPFHALPQALALFQKVDIARQYSVRQRIVWLFAFVLLLLASVAAVSFVRDFQYSESKAEVMPGAWATTDAPSGGLNISKPVPPTLAQESKVVSSFRWILIHQLVVNRWIGIEGAMAVSSYAEKGHSLLWDMLTEKRELGKATAYQAVSNSGYQVPDAKYQFASMPGISAFLYFSGSLWIVFGGMAATVLMALSSERVILWMTANPILCSLYGMTVANTIAQFGMTPRQDIPQYLMFFLAVVLLWGMQSAGAPKEEKLSR